MMWNQCNCGTSSRQFPEHTILRQRSVKSGQSHPLPAMASSSRGNILEMAGVAICRVLYKPMKPLKCLFLVICSFLSQTLSRVSKSIEFLNLFVFVQIFVIYNICKETNLVYKQVDLCKSLIRNLLLRIGGNFQMYPMS